MPELNEEKGTLVANDSLDVIRKYYKHKGEISEEDLFKVRTASAMVGAFMKYKQSESNMGAIKLAVATQILEDPEDRAIYLRVSAPELKLNMLKQTKLVKAGIKPEDIRDKTYQTSPEGYVEKPVV